MQGLKKMWNIKGVLFNQIKEWNSDIWCNTISLENLMLDTINDTQKEKCMIPHT